MVRIRKQPLEICSVVGWDIKLYRRSDQAWQTSGPTTVSNLMLAMLLQITETDCSAVGHIANALEPPILKRTASDDMPNMRTSSFSSTSFLCFALLCQGRHKLLDDSGGHL